MTAVLALSLAAAISLWPREGELTARELVAADLTSNDPGRRVAAILRLGSSGQPQDLRLIVPFLDGGDTSLRLAAARVLVRAAEPHALGVIAAEASDERASVRFEALTLLREAAVLPEAGRHAAERALGDGDPAMRLVALEVLTAHPARESAPIVAGSIGDGNREVRLAAIRLLGLSRDGRVLLPLLEQIDAPDRNERLAVIDALGAIGAVGPSGVPGATGGSASGTLAAGPALARQLVDPNDDVRAAAIEALSRLRFVQGVPVLTSIAMRPRDALSRRAVLALGAIGDPAAIDALVKLLRQPAPSAEVVEALRRAGSPAVKPVAAILTDAYPTSATAAAAILASIGDRAATPSLVAILRGRPLVAIAAARALGALRDPDAVPGLIAAATDPRYGAAAGVREACLRALTAMSDDRAASLVETAANDRQSDVRAAAMGLAAAVRGGLSRDTLGSRILDEEPAVRRAAIAAATALPKLRPAPLLLDALERGANDALADSAGLATALPEVVTEAEESRLWKMLERFSGPWRVIALRGLAALSSVTPPSPRAEAVLVEALTKGGAGGRAAAEILSGARISTAAWPTVLGRLPELEAAIRIRLCPALARAATDATDAALADLIERDPNAGVRAASAWAARSRRRVSRMAATLDRASRSCFFPVAENAHAALNDDRPQTTSSSSKGGGTASADGTANESTGGSVKDWAGVRLLTPDGGFAIGRWIRVRAGAVTIWALTDDAGEARLTDLPPGPLHLAMAGSVWQLSR